MTDEPAGEAAPSLPETETETETAKAKDWRAKRRRSRGGVFVPVDPEKLNLTPKQSRFAALVAAGVPRTVAAETAGYGVARVEASRLARLPHVRAKIRELRELQIDRWATPVLKNIAGFAFGQVPDVKPETRLKALFWMAEAAGYGPNAKKDKEKDNDNNDLREWSIERLQALLVDQERSRRKENATDLVPIAADAAMQTTQPIEKTQETHPKQGSDHDEEGPDGPA